MFGWQGRCLHVDLTSARCWVEQLPQEMLTLYLGGRGLAGRLLFDLMDSRADPLGPDNLIILAVGPFSGTSADFGGRVSMVSKSPQNGLLHEGNAGGFFGPELKWAGYDAVVIRGQSDRPVYLWIDDDKVEIRDARHLWGRLCSDTESLIREELGDQGIQVREIGPAGENLVAQTVIMGNNAARSGGRAGLGAVWGSKRLKAVAVRGTKGVPVHDLRLLEQAAAEIRRDLSPDESLDPATKSQAAYGMNWSTRLHGFSGMVPRRNWTAGDASSIEAYDGWKLNHEFSTMPKACFNCPWPGCYRWCVVRDGPYAGTEMEGCTDGPNFCFGINFDIYSWPFAIKAGKVANDLGLDFFISTTFGWAVEAFERGLLTEQDTDGLVLRWGDEKLVLHLLEITAYRRGRLGELMASGLDRAVQQVGPQSADLAMTAKGVEVPPGDPRAMYLYGLGWAVNNQGGDHTHFYPISPPFAPALPHDVLDFLATRYKFDPREASALLTTKGKGGCVAWLQDASAMWSSLPFCMFLSRGRTKADFRPHAAALLGATGVSIDWRDLLTAGRRIYCTERAFNMRVGGAGIEWDQLPVRMLEEPSPAAGCLGSVVPLEEMRSEYYAIRGWDGQTGLPGARDFEELGIPEIWKGVERTSSEEASAG